MRTLPVASRMTVMERRVQVSSKILQLDINLPESHEDNKMRVGCEHRIGP